MPKPSEKEYPIFYKTCTLLEKSFFYRDIFDLCTRIPIDYELGEKLCSDALQICGNDWEKYEEKLNVLMKLNMDFLRLQGSLEKTGGYLYSTFEEVEREVFTNKKTGEAEGVDYLWGLYFSEIFWVTHHRVFKFFLTEFVQKAGPSGILLDAPIGSGIFSAQFLAANPQWKAVGVDLSKTSIDFCKELFRINKMSDRTELLETDFFAFERTQKFDRIICVEFLEHVEDPKAILRRLKSLLAENGKIFLITVAWAAAVDHIYLYKNAQEIRNHISESGLNIEKEFVQTVFDKDAGKLDGDKIALNYAAILN